jgi:hypothetical protein
MAIWHRACQKQGRFTTLSSDERYDDAFTHNNDVPAALHLNPVKMKRKQSRRIE